MPSRKSRAALASSSSILDRAKPTWIRTQSPGSSFSSSSRPMLIARLTPLTSTLARSGRSSMNSTISPGMPRHMLVLHVDCLQDQLVATVGLEVEGAAGRAGGEGVGGLGLVPAVEAADPDRHRHQVDGRAVGDRALGDQGERLVEGRRHHPVLRPDPDPDPGHAAPGGPSFHRLQDSLAQAQLVHWFPLSHLADLEVAGEVRCRLAQDRDQPDQDGAEHHLAEHAHPSSPLSCSSISSRTTATARSTAPATGGLSPIRSDTSAGSQPTTSSLGTSPPRAFSRANTASGSMPWASTSTPVPSSTPGHGSPSRSGSITYTVPGASPRGAASTRMAAS